MKRYDVAGIGSPLLDFTVEVDDEMLVEIDLEKGNMHLIDAKRSAEILKRLENHDVKTSPGGSSANTLAGISAIGGKSVLFGKVGNDVHGDIYEQRTEQDDTDSKLARHPQEMTGHAITFITPDSERTFATHLGAAIHFEKEDVIDQDIKDSKVLHLEAYQFEDRRLWEVMIHAIDMAKKESILVSADLSDPALIKRNLEHFKDIVKEHVDILFVNEDEAEMFTGKKGRDALDILAKQCEYAVVKLGSRGSLIAHKGGTIEIPPYKNKVVNTNGAGDMYAAGFLYGITHDMDLEKTGNLASFAASLIVGNAGARATEEDKLKLKDFRSQSS